MDPVVEMLIVLAGVLFLGALGEFVFSRTGIPDVIWLVGAGILLGPILQIVSSEALQPVVPFFGAIALTVILSGGSYRLQLQDVAPAAPRGLVLAVLGFTFAVIAICIFLWIATETGHIRPLPFVVWIMIGAIGGGTSALVIMPTMATGHADPRVARILEVESSATDALCVVVTMGLIDVVLSGSTSLTRPLVSLGKGFVIGVGLGAVTWAILIPLVPTLRDKAHGYTTFLASMFTLYAVTDNFGGNGAMAVLTASLLLGNASTIVPRLIPGARGQEFVATELPRVMQGQMNFLIKSFFFVLIGLMFPLSARSIFLGGIAAVFLLAFRFPAVILSVRGLVLSRKQLRLLMIAMPRGLAAGVLSTLPLSRGVPGVEILAGAVFSMVVFSILIFAVAFSVVNQMRASDDMAAQGET